MSSTFLPAQLSRWRSLNEPKTHARHARAERTLSDSKAHGGAAIRLGADCGDRRTRRRRAMAVHTGADAARDARGDLRESRIEQRGADIGAWLGAVGAAMARARPLP